MEGFCVSCLSEIGMLITILFSAICWVTAMLATKPTKMENLKDFYSRVRPIGFWGPVKAELGADFKHESFKKSDLATWCCAVMGVYGFVFGFGKLLLGSYLLGIILITFSAISICAMIRIVSRNEWWREN